MTQISKEAQFTTDLDFLGGPVVKTLPSNARVAGLIPGQGTKIPHDSWSKKKTKHKNRSNIVTHLIKTLKWSTLKKKSLKKKFTTDQSQHHHKGIQSFIASKEK